MKAATTAAKKPQKKAPPAVPWDEDDKGVRFSVYMSAATHGWLKALAKRRGASKSGLISTLVMEAVDVEKQKRKAA